MSLEINYNPSGGESYVYISLYNNEWENIALVSTPDQARIMRHIYVSKGSPPKQTEKAKKYSFMVISFYGDQFIEKYNADVITLGERIWFNGEIWEIRDPKPLSKELVKKLLFYIHFISDNLEEMDKHNKVFEDFNRILNKEMKDYQEIDHKVTYYSDLIYSAI